MIGKLDFKSFPKIKFKGFTEKNYWMNGNNEEIRQDKLEMSQFYIKYSIRNSFL